MEIADVPSRQPDELLYHYTSVESFVSIVKGGALWASHIRYLNDTTEQRILWDHVRVAIKARLDAADDRNRERLRILLSLTDTPLELDAYVLCFSKDGGDRLSQWRGYGGSAGVAIGFDSSELKRNCSTFATSLSRNKPRKMGCALLQEVQYVEPSGDERSKQVIGRLLNNPNELEPEDLLTEKGAFRRRVSLAASSLKHRAFYDEREWRINIFQLPEDFIQFRARKSMMIPYVPFDLGRGRRVSSLIPRVIVGPSPHQEATISAIKKMLDDRVVVVGSSIPYRDW